MTSFFTIMGGMEVKQESSGFEPPNQLRPVCVEDFSNS